MRRNGNEDEESADIISNLQRLMEVEDVDAFRACIAGGAKELGLFDQEKASGGGDLLRAWFNKQTTDIPRIKNWKVTYGIFYVHSYMYKTRVAVYFGDEFADKTKRRNENVHNAKLWCPIDCLDGSREYYHLLDILPRLPAKPISAQENFLVLTFNPRINIKHGDPDRIIRIPWSSPIHSMPDFVSLRKPPESSQEWEHKIATLKDSLLAAVSCDIKTCKPLIDLALSWQKRNGNKGYPLNPPLEKDCYFPFANLLRYSGNFSTKTDEARWNSSLFMYIVPKLRKDTLYSPALVCSLSPPFGGGKAISLDWSVLERFAKRTARDMVFLSALVHSAEISFFQRKRLLPFETEDIPYQEHWLTNGRKIVLPPKSEAKWQPLPSETEDRFKLLHKAQNSECAEVKVVFDEVLKTMQQLAAPGQCVYSSYDTIASRIFECVNKVCRKLLVKKCTCKAHKDGQPCPILDPISRLTKTEGDLRFVPKYHEHFIHSFHVFMFGLAFMREKLSAKDVTLLTIGSRKVPTVQLLKQWFLTAMFHDVAYAVQKMEDLAQDYYFRVLLGETNGIGERGKILTLAKDRLLVGQEMHDYLIRIGRHNGGTSNLAQPLNRALVDKADHGILSSFALFHHVVTRQGIAVSGNPHGATGLMTLGLSGEAVLDVCRAIAFHHAYEPHWNWQSPRPKALCLADRKNSVSNMLLTMLIICDAIAQTGRAFRTNELSLRTHAKLGNFTQDGNIFNVSLFYEKGNAFVPAATPLNPLRQEQEWPAQLSEVMTRENWYQGPRDWVQSAVAGVDSKRKVVVRVFASDKEGLSPREVEPRGGYTYSLPL